MNVVDVLEHVPAGNQSEVSVDVGLREERAPDRDARSSRALESILAKARIDPDPVAGSNLAQREQKVASSAADLEHRLAREMMTIGKRCREPPSVVLEPG